MKGKRVLARTTVLLGVYALVIGFPVALGVTLKSPLVGVLGASWWVVPLVLYTLLAFIGPFLYLAFLRRAEGWLLKTQRRNQAAIRALSQELVGFTDVQGVRTFVGEYVAEEMQLASSELWVVPANGPDAAAGDVMPAEVHAALQQWPDQPVLASGVVAEERLSAIHAGHPPVLLRQWMQRQRLAALVPGRVRSKLVTCLMLGPTRTGEPLTTEDVEVLGILARQSAVLVTNLRLYDEVAQQKRLAQFGQLMYAVSHEFNNILNLLALPLQLVADRLEDSELQRTVKELAHDVRRGRVLTEAAYAYRKKYATSPRTWALRRVVDEALAQAQEEQFAGSAPRFALTVTVPDSLAVSGSETIPELILDALRCVGWACDEKSGTLAISAARVSDGVQMRLTMQGGMDLSTKITGEHQALAAEPGRHGGLYLFLAQLIAHDHDGRLTIEPTPGGGTTLVLWLPS
jgi:signal transduction histidine kinase